MGQITVYCVETFWRDRGHMAKGQLRQFGREDEALEAGRLLGGRMPGVLVYQMRGSPKADFWEDPVILATHGDVPGV